MLRERLVRSIEAGGSWDAGGKWDPRVIDTMREVPRHQFAPGLSLAHAYDDRPMPIGFGQTISQPSMVAIMTQALHLTGRERVLEIGTGSGYQAAVLSKLARDVYSIEIVEDLGNAASTRLRELGYANVHVRIGDGYRGWPEHAPFDRIVLTAAPPEVPDALIEQLAEDGTLLAPVGDSPAQSLLRLRKRAGKIEIENLGPVRFVPMVPGD
ncbi:MAG: protein-L-isoaspartate(D-aspartate) O-methyltransferase [Myxococcales bacterium]|nr:protein-L-isoaspartate(D-aspartate) O-methyltransferase [Myxococcales bacterium]